MRYLLLSVIVLFIYFPSSTAQFSASGGIGTPYEEKGRGGVESVYLYNSLSGAYLTFTSTNTPVSFYKYSVAPDSKVALPASDVTEIMPGKYQINNLQDGWGYIAEEAAATTCVWVIDYSMHQVIINSVNLPQGEGDEDCYTYAIDIDRTESALQYRGIDGTTINLSRLFRIEWNAMEWNGNAMQFVEKEIKKEEPLGSSNLYEIKPIPLKNTVFTVSGDQYARHFGIEQTAESEEYRAIAIEAYILYTDIKNGIENDTLSMSNPTDFESAPITRRFYGFANKPAAYYYEWFIYKNEDETNWIAHYTNETDITYTFTEAGKYKVALEVSSANNACTQAAQPIEFEISESSLEVPNFFSPGTSPGYNDEFKVKYKSLVKFKATIFNRWGNKIFEWNDPEQGWDGKYNGKYVSPGVYFYAIDATGSEGKRYKKAGGINIIRGK